MRGHPHVSVPLLKNCHLEYFNYKGNFLFRNSVSVIVHGNAWYLEARCISENRETDLVADALHKAYL
jgi:hypothetical protein